MDKMKKQSARTAQMDVELGEDWVGDHARAAEAVATRVKTSAQRYGFCEGDDR